jgi:hypothetical protein
MPTPTIPDGELFFNATTYTGTGTTNVITNGAPGQSFQPDFVWAKRRSSAASHGLVDSVRGTGRTLFSNLTDAEDVGDNNLTAFNSNGFTAGSGGNFNTSGQTYVAWQWKAGGAAVTNTAGSISSQVSANTTSGFSVVTYTGNATSGATVGHGLGVAPSMVIVKVRSTTGNWPVYHVATGNTKALYLDLTLGQGGDFTGAWNNTTPTSTVFTLGNSNETNRSSATFVAYCFAPIAGYSAFGSYTGNGSADGTFVYTGFRPKFVLMKATTGSNNWIIYDTVRNTYNLTNLSLVPDSSAAENGVSTTTENTLDILSNGFKLRTSNALTNGSSVPYIYMAFCENPLKYANAR